MANNLITFDLLETLEGMVNFIVNPFEGIYYYAEGLAYAIVEGDLYLIGTYAGNISTMVLFQQAAGYYLGQVQSVVQYGDMVKISKAVSKYSGTRDLTADFQAGSSLTDHAGRHGAKFGYTTEQQYLNAARNFIDNPPAGVQSFVSAEGTYFQYDVASNTFGMVSKYGGISTYMKPDIGINYWLEQIAKYKP